MSIFALLILLSHTGCVVRVAVDNSPVQPEIDSIPAGLSHYWFQRFDLARVNPPLVRYVAVFPLLSKRVSVNWSNWNDFPGSRSERELGQDVLRRNAPQLQHLFFAARLACIPIYLIAALVIFHWAYELYGAAAAHLALLLWCSDPMILGHSALVSTDVAAAALAVLTVFAFVRWMKGRTYGAALLCGLSLGLALSCKFTLILLLPVITLGWFVRRYLDGCVFRDLAQAALVFTIAILLVNSLFLFEGTLLPLKKFQFVSSTLAGPDSGNRWGNSVAGHLLIPLPANYLRGMDQQLNDLENASGEYPSYLCGEWRDVGWWYFYLYGLLVKTPSSTLLLFGLAATSSLVGIRRLQWKEALLLAVPAIVIAAASASHGFTMHLRYIIPASPFLCIWLSRVAADRSGGWQKCGAWCLLACSMISVARASPNWISYYNEASVLRVEGHWHMLSSNMDWGQDVFRLRDWIDKNRIEGAIYADCYGDMAIQLAGIECSKPIRVAGDAAGSPNRPDGLYAISAAKLRSKDGRYQDFLQQAPLLRIGGSIYIYQIGSTKHDDGGRAATGLR